MMMPGPVNLRDELNALTPRLRRYARALATGSPSPSAFADDLVHATLMRALHARPGRGMAKGAGDLAAQLYATVTQVHREAVAVGRSAVAGGAGRPALAGAASPAPPRHTRLSAGLLGLPLESREALLLVALEGFDHAEAARILRVSRGVLIGRLTQARTALDAAVQARPAAPPPVPPSARQTPHQAARQSARAYLRVVS